MKLIKIFLAFSLVTLSTNTYAWVVNGRHIIDKIGINHLQINVSLSNGKVCYVNNEHPNYKEVVALLHVLYVKGDVGFFRCTEANKDYSPWQTGVKHINL